MIGPKECVGFNINIFIEFLKEHRKSYPQHNQTRQERNDILRERIKVNDIIEHTSNVKGQWAGNIARMDNSKWAKSITEWTPREGRWKRGRSKRRHPLENWEKLDTYSY